MKCKDCGITITEPYEIEDKRCANCQAERDKNNKDIKII